MLLSHPHEQGPLGNTMQILLLFSSFRKKQKEMKRIENLFYTLDWYILIINVDQNSVTDHIDYKMSMPRKSLAWKTCYIYNVHCKLFVQTIALIQHQTYPGRSHSSSENRFSIWFVPRTCKKHSRLHAALTREHTYAFKSLMFYFFYGALVNCIPFAFVIRRRNRCDGFV